MRTEDNTYLGGSVNSFAVKILWMLTFYHLCF